MKKIFRHRKNGTQPLGCRLCAAEELASAGSFCSIACEKSIGHFENAENQTSAILFRSNNGNSVFRYSQKTSELIQHRFTIYIIYSM